MDSKRAAIAGLVVLALALVAGFAYYRLSKGTPSSGGSCPATSCPDGSTAKPLPVYSNMTGDVWAEGTNAFLANCPTGYSSYASDHCAVRIDEAMLACNAAPTCRGYLVPAPDCGSDFAGNPANFAHLLVGSTHTDSDKKNTILYTKNGM